MISRIAPLLSLLPLSVLCGQSNHTQPLAQKNYTVLNDTDFGGAQSYLLRSSALSVLRCFCRFFTAGRLDLLVGCGRYSKGRSIDDCAAQCLARPNCVATSWNGPHSHFHNNVCNFDCKSSGRRALKGETAAIILGRAGDLCSMPPPPPPPQPPPPPLPHDWQSRQATGWLLAETTPPLSPYLCPTYGNGFVAATICPGGGAESTGGAFLSGYYSGSCPAPATGAGNARATLPNLLDITGIQNATYVGMALDLQNGTVTRRFHLPGCQVDVSYFAHRSVRHLMVVSIIGSRFVAEEDCIVQPTPPTASNSLQEQSCYTENGVTACNVTAAVPETARQAATVVAIHATALSSSFTLSSRAPEHALVAAFATTLEPGIASKTHAIQSAKMRYDEASQQGVSELTTSHASGWAQLWQSDLQIGGNVSATASLRSSAYYILSSVRDDWAYGSSPGGLASTS